MLLTERREIDIFLPTSVQESAESILTLAADSEESHLLPVLGRPLFDHVDELYREVALDEDWFLPKNGKDVTPQEKLIRLCQEVVVYMTLADNAGLFSVSMNDAGLNTPSSGGYEEADEKRIDRFVKDAFKKGHRAIDRLLVFLEEDASGKNPEFAGLWKSSRFFYMNHDTLFTTASDFDRHVNIDGSREWFVKILPDIRFCQDTYLAPQVGYSLMEALVHSLSSPAPEGQTTHDATVWKTAVQKLKLSLALYAENRNEKLRRKNSRSEADLSLERAKDYIRCHQKTFASYMSDSPLYDKEMMDSDTERKEKQEESSGKPQYQYRTDDDSNAVHGLFYFNQIP